MWQQAVVAKAEAASFERHLGAPEISSIGRRRKMALGPSAKAWAALGFVTVERKTVFMDVDIAGRVCGGLA